MKTVFFLCASILYYNALALRFQQGDNITINNPVHDDVYVAGGTITINAPVYGDLIAAGGTITLNDSVTQDVLIAGGTVIFNGYVGDDIRCAGGSLKVFADVAGDLVITGGEIEIGEKTFIHGDLLVAGGKVNIAGHIEGNVKSAAGIVTLNGTVGGEFMCKADKITANGAVRGKSELAAKEIVVGTAADFQNDVRYWNEQGALDFKQSLGNNTATFDPSLELDSARWHYLGFTSFLILLWYLGMAFLMIFIIEYLFNTIMQRAAVTALNESLKSMGVGFLFFIAVPLAIIISVISIIGVPLAVILLLGYITVIFFFTSITSVVAAHWISNVYYPGWKMRSRVIAAFLIFVILKLVTLTPFAGPLVMALLACLAFGAILLNVKWKRNTVTVP